MRRGETGRLASPCRVWKVPHNSAGPRRRRFEARNSARDRTRSGTVLGRTVAAKTVTRGSMARSKAYRVRYTRDESRWWQASIPAVQGCHTQGRTIEEARRRIREALGLFVDNATNATLKDDVQMPKAV